MNRLSMLLILLFIFCLSSPDRAHAGYDASAPGVLTSDERIHHINTKRAMEEIFGSRIPLHYQAHRGGPLHAEDGPGFYLIMANQHNHTLALVIDFSRARQANSNILGRASSVELADYLFKRYIGIANSTIHVEDINKLALPSGQHKVVRLRVKFKNRFKEPDLLMRLHYDNDRRVILMLGRPVEGNWKSETDLNQSYLLMENEARQIIGQTSLSDHLLPSERYILWRLKHVFGRRH